MSIKLIIVRMVVIKKLIKLKLKLIISFKISIKYSQISYFEYSKIWKGPERFFLDFKPLFLVIFKLQFFRAVFPESKSIKIMKFGSVIREICSI